MGQNLVSAARKVSRSVSFVFSSTPALHVQTSEAFSLKMMSRCSSFASSWLDITVATSSGLILQICIHGHVIALQVHLGHKKVTLVLNDQRGSLSNSSIRPPDKSVYQKLFSLFLVQKICCGYSKEPSR